MFEEIEGVRVYFERTGNSGPKVILLHGWGCSAELMKPVAEGLCGDHQLLVPDFPGHGKSGRPPEPWGVPEYGACLLKLLQRQDFLPCAAVAHSFGGRIAVWLAAENPDVFTKLVLTGAAGLKKPASADSDKRNETYQRLKTMVRKAGKIPGLATLSDRLQERLIQKYGSADYKALDPEMRQTFNRVIGLDLRNLFPRIQQSTRLIWGENDTETPLWMGREMEKMIPDAGLVIFEGRSHFDYLEEAGRFNTILRSFV